MLRTYAVDGDALLEFSARTKGNDTSMNIISSLLEACVVALYEKGVIDWIPDDDAPETFEAECEIEFSDVTVTVTLCGWYLFLFNPPQEEWHVYYAMSTTILPCADCTATFAANELYTVDGQLLCDYCRHQRAQPKVTQA